VSDAKTAEEKGTQPCSESKNGGCTPSRPPLSSDTPKVEMAPWGRFLTRSGRWLIHEEARQPDRSGWQGENVRFVAKTAAEAHSQAPGNHPPGHEPAQPRRWADPDHHCRPATGACDPGDLHPDRSHPLYLQRSLSPSEVV